MIDIKLKDIQLLADNYNLSIEQATYLCRKSSPYCTCGKFKKLRKGIQSPFGIYLFGRCDSKQCSPAYGKVRPDHSIKMKYLAKNGSDVYKNTLAKKGELYNKEVNSVNFKRKLLINKKYDCSKLQDNEVIELFNLFQSTRAKGADRRRKEILNRFNAWEKEFQDLILIITKGIVPTKEWLISLEDDQIQILWKRIHGINTIRNFTRVKQTRPCFFKHELLNNFHYNNKHQQQIYVRSGLEKEYVRFFETNKILWEYETIRIETIHKDGFHIPDFLIFLNNECILLEVKGSFYKQPYDEYYANKILAAIQYCNKNNIRYILTQKYPDASFDFIKNSLIDSKRK